MWRVVKELQNLSSATEEAVATRSLRLGGAVCLKAVVALERPVRLDPSQNPLSHLTNTQSSLERRGRWSHLAAPPTPANFNLALRGPFLTAPR